MMTLRNKAASGIRLSREEEYRLKHLAEERDELASRIVFHTY
jgi:predicted DNA-binding protein